MIHQEDSNKEERDDQWPSVDQPAERVDLTHDEFNDAQLAEERRHRKHRNLVVAKHRRASCFVVDRILYTLADKDSAGCVGGRINRRKRARR
jgi:hypothetical protein